MAAKLDLVISAKDNASGVLDRVGAKSDGLSGKLKLGLATAGVAAAGGIGVLAVAGLSFIKQAADEEAGIKRLTQAVENSGASWEQASVPINQFIRDAEKLAFSDDSIRESLSLLTAQTGNYEEAMKRQKVAMDLSRGAGIDLITASKLLGKVTDENVNVLARYGIRAEEGMDATALLARVQERFGGQSEAFADSAAGKWGRFNIALDNIKETIGEALLPLVTRLGEKLAIFLEENQDDIERMVQSFNEWAEEALPKIERFVASDVLPTITAAIDELSDAWQQFGPLAEDAVSWLKENEEVAIGLAVALGILVAAIAGPIIAIPALVAAGTLLLANWDEIKAKAIEVWTSVQEWIDNTITKVQSIPIIGDIFRDTLNTIQILLESYVRTYIAIFEFLFASFKNTFDFWKAVFSGDWSAAWDAVKAQFETTVGLFDDILGIALDALTGIVSTKLEMLKGIGSDIGNAIIDGLTAAVNAGLQFINDLLPDDVSLGSVFGQTIGVNLPDNPLGQIGSGTSRPITGGRRGRLEFAAGGTVPGPVGAPQLAVVHGGEDVVPVGGWVRIEALLAAILAAVERGSSLSIDGREIALATSPHLGQAAYLRGRAG